MVDASYLIVWKLYLPWAINLELTTQFYRVSELRDVSNFFKRKLDWFLEEIKIKCKIGLFCAAVVVLFV